MDNNALIAKAIAGLDSWLETWKDSKGGIHGFVVHHHLEAMQYLAPDTWTQSSAILGHIEIFKKTGKKKWLAKALKEASFLAKTYEWKNHFFKNSNFEQKRPDSEIKASLIHNAYPCIALLELSKALKAEGREFEKFFRPARDCCNNYIIAKCWSSEKKAFARGIDEKNPEFVLNMASNAVKALLLLDEIENGKNKILEKYCTPCIYSIISLQKGNGAFPYSDRSKLQISLYQALTMQGLTAFFEKKREKKTLASLEKAKKWLEKMTDKKTGLFCHRIEKGRTVKFPEFIAGSLIMAQQLKNLEKFGIKSTEWKIIAGKVIEKQHESGGIETFHGFTDVFMKLFYPAEPEKKKWRDVLPVPGWNALAFYALAEMLKEGSKIPEFSAKFPCRYENEEFEIIEEKSRIRFLYAGSIVAEWAKRLDYCSFCHIPLRLAEDRKKHSKAFLEKKLGFFKFLKKDS